MNADRTRSKIVCLQRHHERRQDGGYVIGRHGHRATVRRWGRATDADPATCGGTDSRYPETAVSIVEHVRAAGRGAAETITCRESAKGTMRSQFIFLRVRPAGHRVARDTDGLLPERWLIAQWPDDQAEPAKYWLSSLPAATSHTDLVRYGKIRWRIEHDYRELKTRLGLDHFEGRSSTGWHRCVTLVTAAHQFLTELRLDPRAAAPA
jgi:SRSO17 transposase